MSCFLLTSWIQKQSTSLPLERSFLLIWILKMTRFEKFSLVSDKTVFQNCGHREDIEHYYNSQTLEVISNYTLENELNTSVQFLQKCSNVRICMTLSDKRFKRALHKLLFLHEYNRNNMFLLSIFLMFIVGCAGPCSITITYK